MAQHSAIVNNASIVLNALAKLKHNSY